ncbi:hypothetical protein OTU49_015308 [Cherax quadricarinatus]|uniref:Secreted protein n=1 Tax=Cherax quadricarinatus TaxID=27406 RepID=A0AAW0Y082_CHEQU|nr:uncharacterized protein LOC128685517 isoform X1 [Cherax quadricarinatus]
MVRTWQIILLLLTAKMASSGLTRERRAFSANSQHIYSPSLGSYSLGNPLYKACTERPTIANAQVRCLVSGCRVKCNTGYRLQSGYVSAMLLCNHNTDQLIYHSRPWTPSLTTCTNV